MKLLFTGESDFRRKNLYKLIFRGLTGHYLDETIPEEIRLFMFQRDLHTLFTDSSPQPAFFFESSRIYQNTIQAKLKSILESRVKIHLDQKEGKLLLRRFALNHLEKKEFFEGSTHSELFYLCEKLSNSLRKFHIGTPHLSV